MEIFDLIVIGGGPAGYLAAERAGGAGLNTLVIEARNLGGVCLNEGCIPSKALLYCAKVYEHAKDGSAFGVSTTDAKIDQEFVIKRKNRVVKKLVAGVKAKLKANKVTVVNGFGKVAGKSADGFIVQVEDIEYTGKKLLIATGSETIVPPIPGVAEGIDKRNVLTNREILDLTEIPKSLVVIGGGVIGLEMASYYNSVGSNVTVVEMLDHIGGPLDSDISNILFNDYEKKGVSFLLNTQVTKVTAKGVTCMQDGKEIQIDAEKILLSVGRRAITKNVGLESIGVYLEKGAVVTDKFARTNITNVYAAGDVNGKSLLAHTAYREAEVAVNHILGKKDIMRYNAIPSVIYTTPEVASVGETEASAKEKGYDIKVATLPMSYSGRYLAEEERGSGICKLVLDSKHNCLLGVHLIGSYASEIIYGAAILLETEMSLDAMKEIVFPHPTVSEIIKETLFAL